MATATSFFARTSIIAPKEFNRWLIPPAALAIHLSIGQVYAFSVFKAPLMEFFAVREVAVGWIFSLAIGMLGLSSAVAGNWVEKVGPRTSMATAGLFWVIGFFVAIFGLAIGQLWLVYLGYGVIGGIGLGIGYISPVSTLMKWFPDKPGLATGMAIMGFGGGALIASPASNTMMEFFGGGSGTANLADGLYGTFLTLAILYLVVIALGAYAIRLPHPDWKPKGYQPENNSGTKMKTTGNVSANTALRTPQFWLLWVVLFVNVTAGIGILENAAPMVQDYFAEITAGAAAGYVGLLSLANMGGSFCLVNGVRLERQEKHLFTLLRSRITLVLGGCQFLFSVAGHFRSQYAGYHFFLRRWLFYSARLPERSIRCLQRRSDPRSVAHGMGCCRCRRPTDREHGGGIPCRCGLRRC